MTTTKFLILLASADAPMVERRTRIFQEDGTEILGITSLHTTQPHAMGTRLTLEFDYAEIVHIDKPPHPQTEFYSPTFPPGVKPARVGLYLAKRFGLWQLYPWNGKRWRTEHGDLGPRGQPFHWCGLAFNQARGPSEQDRIALATLAERAAAAKQAQRLTGAKVVHHLDGNPLNNDLANLATTRPRPNPRVPNR